LLCVQLKTPDDGRGPKYVEFYSINKFEKLVHLAGFIIRDFETLLLQLSFHLSLIVIKVDARHTQPLTDWMNDLVNRSVNAQENNQIAN